nr:hypothetical protein BaRGS_008725 [Batillaria attramentaria]
MVKAMIQNKTGIPPAEQTLMYPGRGEGPEELKDGHYMSEYLIAEDETELWLEPWKKTNWVAVETSYSDSFIENLEVMVKAMIQNKTGIPPAEQTLMYPGHDKGPEELKDGHYLSEYFNPEKTMLMVWLKERGKRTETNWVAVETSYSDSFIENLEVVPSETIKSVKDKIQEVAGFNAEDQVLLFAGEKLKDDSTLSSNNIRRGSKLKLAPKQGNTFISVDTNSMGQYVDLRIDPFFNVQMVKAMIQNKTGIPPAEQTLMYPGRGEGPEELKDGHYMSEYLIAEDETELWLEPWKSE